jgi:hypothetical protein
MVVIFEDHEFPLELLKVRANSEFSKKLDAMPNLTIHKRPFRWMRQSTE